MSKTRIDHHNLVDMAISIKNNNDSKAWVNECVAWLREFLGKEMLYIEGEAEATVCAQDYIAGKGLIVRAPVVQVSAMLEGVEKEDILKAITPLVCSSAAVKVIVGVQPSEVGAWDLLDATTETVCGSKGVYYYVMLPESGRDVWVYRIKRSWGDWRGVSSGGPRRKRFGDD